MTLWSQWQPLLEALTGKINIGAHTNIKLSAKGVLEDLAARHSLRGQNDGHSRGKGADHFGHPGAGGQLNGAHQGQGARSEAKGNLLQKKKKKYRGR